MKFAKSFIISLATFIIFSFVTVKKANAACVVSMINSYDVDVTVNSDSTFDVSEKISYRASGECSYIYREITLTNYDNLKKCQSDSSLQCGGFSYLQVTGVYDSNNNKVDEKNYSVTRVNNGIEDRLKIYWQYGKTTFDNEIFTWTINYKVFGGLGFYDTYDLFYWNVFYPDRTYTIENALFTIKFPEDINFSKNNLKVYTNTYGSYTYYDSSYDNKNYKLTIKDDYLPPYENYTVMISFPKNIVEEHASLNLTLSPDTQDVTIDGIKIKDVKDGISGITPGDHEILFEASGYKEQKFDLNFVTGETKELTVKLEMSLLRKLLIAGIVLGNVCGCIFGMLIVFWPIASYLKHGKDKGLKGVIYPQFKPPRSLSPVLIGSVKDEKVNTTDITSAIINAAVRGFIKIKEISKNNYKLIKLKEFVSSDISEARKEKYDTIDESEVKILDDIFGGQSEKATSDLKNSFYIKIKGINDFVYDKMVENGYFEKRPDKVRALNLGIGIAMVIGGIALTIGSFFIFIFTFGPLLVISGIVKVIFSFGMPSKTPNGSDIYEKAKGFRMFLYTAERYKLQKELTPDLFEKYLPYAMVFGVEKQWAKNFEHIYDEAPDWYEGSNWDTFNTILFTNSLSNMMHSTSTNLSSTPSSSSSGWSGGGWSGGGGFSGGFSGGGGGGGGGGMG